MVNIMSKEEQEIVQAYESGEITEEQYEELMHKEGWLK